MVDLIGTNQPQIHRAPPSPAVARAIRAEMKRRKLMPADRRLISVAANLGAEPLGVPGLNQGIFYPPISIPDRLASLAPSRAVRARPTTGKLNCLVLLVDFTDNPGSRPPADIDGMLFSRGTYATGSMHDFYFENSYGKLDLGGKAFGWLRMPQPYAYYVGGQTGTGPYPTNAQKLVEDALHLAAATVDFRQFDGDGDGFVDGLFVVHAGGGAEADPAAQRANKVWSHQWNITQPFVSNGVTAYSYCIVPEDGHVGVFSHEFGHMLGLPDLYDTTYNSEGAGVWCVMAAGSWNDGGITPGHFCVWAKARLGWITPKNVRTGQSLSLPPIETIGGAGYRLWTKGAGGLEYFLIENRQLVAFDKKLPGAGLLIWHVDDGEHNNDHPANYWVGVRQADGRMDLETGRNRGDDGDPFPGSSRNTKFDAKTKPAASDKFGRATSVSVSGISIKNGVVTCTVKV